MVRIEDTIDTGLRGWVGGPALLEVSQGRGARETTPPELEQRILETARQLQSWGIGEKSLVPLFLANSADFIVVFLALLHLRAVPVLAKMEYRSRELSEIFRNAEPHAVIADEGHLRFLAPYLTGRITIVRTEGRLSLLQSGDGRGPREDLPDTIASINYTYRGYGYPLGAMISHDHYLHGARVLQEGLQGSAGEKMLLILPMAHIFTMVGCILVPLLYGITPVIVDTMHPRLLFQYIRDFRIEHVTSVPEIYDLLLRVHDASTDLSSLKVFVSGGSVLTPQSYARLVEAFPVDVLHGYGLTEFTPVSRNSRKEARPGTVGPLCGDVECRIADNGEILVRVPHETAYYRRAEETRAAQDAGWFKTGDKGHLDGGHLVFERELKNTRKVNGNMVDLEEVALAIRADGEIAEARVGWENNSVSAALALRRGADLEETAGRLKKSLGNVLAVYKIPRRFSVL